VLLHNDDVHEMGYVTQVLCQIASLGLSQAFLAMLRAHREGVALVLETHREHAELVAEQLASAGLSASIGPSED
jgi:ATP-dependent Clp protease adapter protein ClpS